MASNSEIRFLTPLSIDTGKQKKIVVLRNQASNILIIKIQIS